MPSLNYGDTVVLFSVQLHATIDTSTAGEISVITLAVYIKRMIYDISTAFAIPYDTVDVDVSLVFDWVSSFSEKKH